ncbi:MAG: metallophosphoesterase [Pseudomonadota bacterium]
MIAKLFRRQPAPDPPAAAIPDGERIYAVGDIHGRLDLLDDLIDRIVADDARRGAAHSTIIFLGDLIDRGPDSAQVVERLRRFSAECPAATRFLLGNHEEVFLAVLSGDVKALRFFNRIGGRETILSYGITRAEYDSLDYPQLLDRTQAIVPPEHRDFLRGFEDMVIAGDYAFVHAGVRPTAPLDQQRASDLRWIREEFLNFGGALEKIVVHGHSIADSVEVRRHRIGLDTGAYSSGRLTAMGFERGERWVLQTEGPTPA